MRFTLTYDGPLSSAGNSVPHKDQKHEIRRQFHRQLAELWSQRPSLRTYLETYRQREPSDEWQDAGPTRHPGPMPTAHYGSVAQGILVPFPRCGFTFVPLATKRYDLSCELDILFLRNQPPGKLFEDNAGDLDGRVKLLFDALRVPRVPGRDGATELPPTAKPEPDEDPFFCLMENDDQITAFRLESERLLDRSSPAGNHVRLVIRVDLKVRVVRAITLEFQGD